MLYASILRVGREETICRFDLDKLRKQEVVKKVVWPDTVVRSGRVMGEVQISSREIGSRRQA